VRMSASPTDVTRAPLLGEQIALFYAALFGRAGAELDALKRDGVI
jgi:hypothetical protein